MNYQEYLSIMKTIQNNLLNYIDSEDDIEENYQNLIQVLQDQINFLKSILYLLLYISKNHYRGPNFYSKISQILIYLKNDIQNKFSNFGIFTIFKSSKMILLILIKEEIMTIDESIYKSMTTSKYLYNNYYEFFYPEINPFVEKEKTQKSDIKDCIRGRNERFLPQTKMDIIPDDFEERRKVGQNDSEICKLIRNDSIEEFIIYMNKSELSLTSTIPNSIYDTNTFLTKNKVLVTDCFRQSFDAGNNPTLIEYAAFFGSVQIFNYLYKNGVQLNHSLWLYAIHSDNSEIIHILEENKIYPSIICLLESIKCHHNDITNYIQSKYLEKVIISSDTRTVDSCFHYYNFAFFPTDTNYNLNHCFLFEYACKYDYLPIVEFFLSPKMMDSTGGNDIFYFPESDIFKLCYFAGNKNKYEIVSRLLQEVKFINNDLFEGCDKLTQLNIPPNIELIGSNAFSRCKSLISINIPSSVTVIYDSSFKGCSSLEEIIIPSSIQSIPSKAFSGCISLKKIKIPSSVTSIQFEAFNECLSLEFIEIPSSVTVIGHSAFAECESLKQITLPNISKINYGTFSMCSSLEKVFIPSSVIFIDFSAFYGCSSLAEISIPSSVIEIGKEAFRDCSSLKKISFENPSSVKLIGIDCFNGCSSLDEVFIPSSVETIGKDAFQECLSLKKLTISSHLNIDGIGISNNVNVIKI